MALIITLRNPQHFITLWRNELAFNRIKTWKLDSDGDYTLANSAWRSKAWFRSFVEGNRIIFGIVPSAFFPMTNELYGVYHGRLAATLVANYCDEIDSLEITPQFHERDIQV